MSLEHVPTIAAFAFGMIPAPKERRRLLPLKQKLHDELKLLGLRMVFTHDQQCVRLVIGNQYKKGNHLYTAPLHGEDPKYMMQRALRYAGLLSSEVTE